MRGLYAAFAGAGILGVIAFFALSLAAAGAAVYFYIEGVIFGFHHGILLGLVSLFPLVGFLEGVGHALGLF